MLSHIDKTDVWTRSNDGSIVTFTKVVDASGADRFGDGELGTQIYWVDINGDGDEDILRTGEWNGDVHAYIRIPPSSTSEMPTFTQVIVPQIRIHGERTSPLCCSAPPAVAGFLCALLGSLHFSRCSVPCILCLNAILSSRTRTMVTSAASKLSRVHLGGAMAFVPGLPLSQTSTVRARSVLAAACLVKKKELT